MIARRQHVGQVQRLLVRHTLRNRQQVHVALGHAHVLCLSTCKATREVRIAKESCVTMAIHGVLQSRRVGTVTERGKLLLAVRAFTARNLEGSYDAFADLQVVNTWA